MIFDGTNYQLVSSSKRQCPVGFIDVNDEYCIEEFEHPNADWWESAQDCHDRNAKLCTWAQWYYACQDASLGITDMTDNWEWLNCPVNAESQVLIMGNGGCQIGNVAGASTNKKHRCCYSK